MKFVFHNNEWWQVHNTRGYGRFGKTIDVDPRYPYVEADSFRSLDWSCLLKRKSNVGWIAPDGTWFGCSNNDIDDVAELFLNSSEEKLQENGWIKIYKSVLTRKREWYTKGMQVNNEQALILCTKGFLIEDWQMKED